MRTKFFLLITLALVIVQGWAIPIDSLKVHSGDNNVQTMISEKFDGIGNPVDFVIPGNTYSLVTDLVHADGTVETTSTSSTSNNSQQSIPVGSSIIYTFTFKSYYTSHEPAKLVDYTGMYTDSTTLLSTGSNYKEWKTVVTYKPNSSGRHNATLYLYVTTLRTIKISFNNTAVVPQIGVSSTSLNFGTVAKGNTVSKTINVTGTNLTGNLTLSTGNAFFTVSPTTITAAQAAAGKTVTVTYKPTSVGTHNATLTIKGGGAPSKTVSLTGKCENPPTPTITVNPTSLAFGTVIKGKTSSKTFTVKGTDLTGSLTISSNNSNFTVSPTTITAAQAAEGKTVTVTYKPSAAGSHSGTITVSGGGAAAKTVSVTGKCVNPPTITVNLTSLNFGTVIKGNTSSKTFTVKGTDLTGSLTISSNNSNFTVSPTTITAAQAAAGKTVTVTYKPTATGSHSGTITISGGGATSITITITGTCVVPAITTNTSSLAFGTVIKGKTSSKTITVKGTNLTGSLTISSNNSNFTVSPTTITAAQAAAGKTVTVTYKPSVAGSHSGTITVSGGGASPKTVSVTGNCVVPKITVSTTSLLFAGYLDTKTFKVTGTNLTGNLTVTISGSYFTVSPTTITVAEAKAGKNVLVQCVAPIQVQHATGKITISGGGAAPVIVNLSFVADGPVPYAPVVEPEGGSEDDNEVFMNGGSLSVNENMTTDVDELAMASKVYAEGQVIIIESPVEQEAIVSDLSGRAQRVNLQTGRNEIPVNASGVYIVRIKDKTTKLMLR